MVDRDTLIALAERCEKAAGADRELDALIAPLQGLRVVDEGHPLGRCCYDASGVLVVLPRYTASLDAAATLVPKGLNWTVDSAAVAYVQRLPSHLQPTPNRGSAPTPALALTAAALRARAQEVR